MVLVPLRSPVLPTTELESRGIAEASRVPMLQVRVRAPLCPGGHSSTFISLWCGFPRTQVVSFSSALLLDVKFAHSAPRVLSSQKHHISWLERKEYLPPLSKG